MSPTSFQSLLIAPGASSVLLFPANRLLVLPIGAERVRGAARKAAAKAAFLDSLYYSGGESDARSRTAGDREAEARKAERHHRPGRRLRNPRCRHGAADAEVRHINVSSNLFVIGARAEHIAEARGISRAAKGERRRSQEGSPKRGTCEERQGPRSELEPVDDGDSRRIGGVRRHCQVERAGVRAPPRRAQ
jgi:hypothetical protein